MAMLAVAAGGCDVRENPAVATLGPVSAGTKTFFIFPSTINLFVGQSARLNLFASPLIGPFNWRSNQPRTVAVDEFGIVTGVAPGTATITVTAAGDPRAFASATVVVRTDPEIPPPLSGPGFEMRPGTR